MSHPDPNIVARDALKGAIVGLSVSESADLARLGLTPRHADLAVGELARSIVLAGGTIAYGGRLRNEGVTAQLLNEVERFGSDRHCLTLVAPFPEHCALTRDELHEINDRMGLWGKLLTLDEGGDPMDWRSATVAERPKGDRAAAAYSKHREFLITHTHTRVFAGGKLRGYVGAMPGVVEEALLAVRQNQPIYLAAGFGGATMAIARTLGLPVDAWAPAGLPEGAEELAVTDSLDQLEREAVESQWAPSSDGLSPELRIQLAATHRPGEVASLCVAGLAAARFSRKTGG